MTYKHAIHGKRLLKLAAHLEKGKLGHKQFNFAVVNATKVGGRLEEMDHNGCGTAGCALGECPIVFPKEWHFDEGAALLRSRKNTLWGNWTDASHSAREFFGLEHKEVVHLFVPFDQDTATYGGRELSNKAKPQSVARNIRIFVEKKRKGEIL